MTRAERITGMISMGLANGLILGGTLAGAHRGYWWGAAMALIVFTAVAYAVAGAHGCRGWE